MLGRVKATCVPQASLRLDLDRPEHGGTPTTPAALTSPPPSGKDRPGNPALRPFRSMTMPARGLPSNELTVRALPFYYYGFRYAG